MRSLLSWKVFLVPNSKNWWKRVSFFRENDKNTYNCRFIINKIVFDLSFELRTLKKGLNRLIPNSPYNLVILKIRQYNFFQKFRTIYLDICQFLQIYHNYQDGEIIVRYVRIESNTNKVLFSAFQTVTFSRIALFENIQYYSVLNEIVELNF